ncbi:MAG: flavin reductase family protein [Bacteroidales bacterium]|nr:flavin reductase family protein [Bacteroidales bacterium]
MEIDPKQYPIPKLFGMMLGAIAPRPIAFASTVDEKGNPNLAPFSFFNGFGANPPILVFSPSRRGRDNTTKHTYDNIKKIPEVVINVVNYDMVYQTSLASSDFPEGVNEFEKAGFTAVKSDIVKPARVKESPVSFECKVLQVIETGDQGAAGNLVICEIVKIHIDDAILNDEGVIDPNKIDLVGRMGGDYYVRASGKALFEVEKPLSSVGIGIDSFPENIRLSEILSGNDLGRLGNLKSFPTQQQIVEIRKEPEYIEIHSNLKLKAEQKSHNVQILAHKFIALNQVEKALAVLMAD